MPSFSIAVIAQKIWGGQKPPVSENHQTLIDNVLKKVDPCNREQVLAAHTEITRMGTLDELLDPYVRGDTMAKSLDAAATLILFAHADKQGATLDGVLKPRDAAQQTLAENLSLTGREVLKQRLLGSDQDNVFLKYFALEDRQCLDHLADQGDVERCDTKDSLNASIEKDASADTTAGLANPLVDGSWQSWTTEKKLKVADEVWTHARECEKEGSFKAAADDYVCSARLFQACGHTKSAAELHFKAAKHYAGCHAKTNDPEDALAARDFMTHAADGLRKAGWSQRAQLVDKELAQYCALVGLTVSAGT